MFSYPLLFLKTLICLIKGYSMLQTINDLSKNVLQNFQSLSLLLARLAVAYGFFEPAVNKWKDIDGIASWFGTMGIPFPTLNAYMAASTEALGVVLLTIGLFTRLISVPLMVVMVVAIMTVHLAHGFSAGDNGFEIPLYYMLFLFIFASHGAGKFSVDYFLFEKK
jgi:putative oxidoreductase